MKTSKVRRLVNEDGKIVLTFSVDDQVWNLSSCLEFLSKMLGQIVHHVVGGQSMQQFDPSFHKANGSIPQGYYHLLVGVNDGNGQLIWRERTGMIFIENDSSDSSFEEVSPAEVLSV